MDEFALIRQWTEGKQSALSMTRRGVVTGIGDDAAVVRTGPGMQLVLTCDTMTEQIHFQPVTMNDDDIGYKAMASAVSDIAAMGGIPRYALLAVTLPKGTEPGKMQRIYEGLYACAERHDLAIVGGDTTSSAAGLTLTVTVVGEVEEGRALTRSSAKAGDAVFVTGFPGLSAAGLELLLERGDKAEGFTPEAEWAASAPCARSETELSLSAFERMLVRAHRRPEPQVAAGRLLLANGCHALNDVSDGIASEAWEIAEASKVCIELEEERMPVAEALAAYAAAKGKSPLDYIMYGGEDYELLGTIPSSLVGPVQTKLAETGISLNVLGTVVTGEPGVRMKRTNGTVVDVPKNGYNHFR